MTHEHEIKPRESVIPFKDHPTVQIGDGIDLGEDAIFTIAIGNSIKTNEPNKLLIQFADKLMEKNITKQEFWQFYNMIQGEWQCK